MSIQSISRRALLALLCAGALTGPLAATSYVQVSDEALVDESTLAVVARVTAVDRSVVLKDRRGAVLITEYALEVEESLKGDAPGHLRMRVPGGIAPDGTSLKIFGMPRFRAGDRALVFLEPDGRGAWRPAHLLLGAFRQVQAGDRSVAVRNLREATEVRKSAEGVETVSGNDRLRDFDGFVRWVAARGAGARPEADYLVGYVDTQVLRQVIVDKYTLFEDDDDGANLRWFLFDTGGDVPWKAYTTGQQGVSGGGYSEFQAALKAWNDDPLTPIAYRYNGKTSSTNGLETYDTVNTIVFNDPTNLLPAFSCASGGVLALGGPWYETQTTNHEGRSFHRIVNADVITNSGLGCFFQGSPNASKAAQELFGHELGHTLGLAHACGDANSPDPACLQPELDDALMRAFIHDDQRGARLAPDDRAGIRDLYSQLPAAPLHLTATPVSTTEIRLAWEDVADNETGYRVEAKPLGGSYAEVATAPANSTTLVVGGLSPATGYAFRVTALSEAGASAPSNEAIAATLAPVAPCVADSHTLCLNQSRFKVTVGWKINTGQTGVASHVAVPSDDSGLLWFFEQNNWEMLVKVLDGCAVNNHYWVFFVAATDVQYTLTVVDTKTGQTQVYFNPLGTPSPLVTDTSAFATCP